MPDYFCVKCEKKLNVEKELSNNVKRLNSIQYGWACVAATKRELLDEIKSTKYTCEGCLFEELPEVFGSKARTMESVFKKRKNSDKNDEDDDDDGDDDGDDA